MRYYKKKKKKKKNPKLQRSDMQLNIAVKKTVVQVVRPVIKRRASRNIQKAAPVKEVKLSWYAEQEIYDRMYEAEVWKNGHFFGYRSKVAQHWHSSDQAKAAAEAPLSTETKRKLYRLLDELN